jgi:HPt (histidine-containing phosphotransfer) domain-containing protein
MKSTGCAKELLKGVAMNIGGKAMQEVALEIEVAARNRELDRAQELVPKLQKEFERLKYSIGEQQPS